MIVFSRQIPVWFPLTMHLAQAARQRREDSSGMQFSDIKEGRLYITQNIIQIKTGMKIAIPLSLDLPIINLRLGTIINRCRLLSRMNFPIGTGVRKNNADGNIHPAG